MTPDRRPSQWPILFDLAIAILDRFEEAQGFKPMWSFGGGTALMLQIDHRESHDIDLFLDDPQVLPFLNPETQGYALSRSPDSYEGDGTRALKLVFADLGEIDFICCAGIVEPPCEERNVRGQHVLLETPAEIIAKKVWYRGGHFLPRDMFDMAAVAEHLGTDYVLAALRQCGKARCKTALATIEAARPEFVQAAIDKLVYRKGPAHLTTAAQSICRDLLEQAISPA
jgi:hypothetical protein